MPAIEPAFSASFTHDLPHIPYFTSRFQTSALEVTPTSDGGADLHHTEVNTTQRAFVDSDSHKTVLDTHIAAPSGTDLGQSVTNLLSAAQAAGVSSVSAGHTFEGPGFTWNDHYVPNWSEVPQQVQGVFNLSRGVLGQLPN